MVAASPVVPQTTMASVCPAICLSMSLPRAGKSTVSRLNGVMIAVADPVKIGDFTIYLLTSERVKQADKIEKEGESWIRPLLCMEVMGLRRVSGTPWLSQKSS